MFDMQLVKVASVLHFDGTVGRLVRTTQEDLGNNDVRRLLYAWRHLVFGPGMFFGSTALSVYNYDLRN